MGRIEQPWRTTKPRNMMKHQRPSIRSQYQRIEGQSPPRTFRDSKKYLRREKAIAAAKLASSSGSSDPHLTKSQRSKAKAKEKAARKEEEAETKKKKKSIHGQTT